MEEKTKKQQQTLTEKEIRQIRHYCTLPVFAFPAFIDILLLCVSCVVFMFIDSVVFHGPNMSPYKMFLFLFTVGFCFVLMALMICSLLIPKIGMKGKKWQAIVAKTPVKQKKIRGEKAAVASAGLGMAGKHMSKSDDSTVAAAGAAAQVASTAAAAVSVHEMSESLMDNAEAVAKAWKIKEKTWNFSPIWLFITPCLILLALYIPEFIMSAMGS